MKVSTTPSLTEHNHEHNIEKKVNYSLDVKRTVTIKQKMIKSKKTIDLSKP